MINLNTESIVSFAEACQRLPRRRAGRPTHPATLYRWASEGLKGIRLETIQVGGTLCTSIEALQRFFDRLSVSWARPPAHDPTNATSDGQEVSDGTR